MAKKDYKGISQTPDMNDNNLLFFLVRDMFERHMPSVMSEVLNTFLNDEDTLSTIAGAVFGVMPMPENGKDGDKGEKGDRGKDGANGKDGKDGRDGIDGKTPIKGVDYFTEAEIRNIIQNSIKDPEYDATDIVKKINELPITPNKQIDVKHIKGLDSVRAGAKLGGIQRGGLKLIWNTQLDGDVNGTNKIFTVPSGQPDPKDNKFLVSVRGVLKTSDAGDFTTSSNNRTITFDSAPPNGSDAPRIILYHGK